MIFQNTWTKEMIADLLRLRDEGKALTAIGRELGEKYGRVLTRHAISKKLRRLGAPAKPPKAPKLTPVEKRLAMVCDDPTPPPMASEGLPFEALRGNQCKWEISGSKDKNQYVFCGHPVVRVTPYAYCYHHAMLAYYVKEKA